MMMVQHHESLIIAQARYRQLRPLYEESKERPKILSLAIHP